MKKFFTISTLLLCTVAFAQQSTPAVNYIVVDSTGKTIGQVVGVLVGGHPVVVAITSHGRTFLVDVVRNGFQKISGLMFATTDCSGQPYLDGGSVFLQTTVTSNNRLYAESGPGQPLTVLSGFDSSGNCFQTNFPLDNAVPVTQVLNLNMFKPPFTVQAQ